MRRPIVFTVAILLALSARAAFAQSPAPAADEKPKREGAITGRVLGDDGQPLEGVQLIAAPAGKSTFSFAPQMVGSDEDGNFKLTGLSRGAFQIVAMAPGYVEANELSEPRRYRVGESATINLAKGGVITGRITGESGEPLVGARVTAHRLRDLEGNTTFEGNFSSGLTTSRETDDRGVYRIYGLRPGAYIVGVHGMLFPSTGASRTVLGQHTYHPSSSRGSAAEIALHLGEELSNVDIRHREVRGFSISGTFTGEVEGGGLINAIAVLAQNVADGQLAGQSTTMGGRRFSIPGVGDGEYELIAMKIAESLDLAASPPRRVTVKGADVGGIELRLAKLGAISGRATLETLKSDATCKPHESFTLDEMLILSKRDDAAPGLLAKTLSTSGEPFSYGSAAPDEGGAFTLKNLEPGLMRLEADLPGDHWFVRSITRSEAGAAKPVDAIALKAGESLSGFQVRVAEGAASLRGKVVPASASSKLPQRLHVHLVPAEAAAAGEVLRYAEVVVAGGGAFELKHLAPGRYWLLAKSAAEAAKDRSVAWDAASRAALRREADAAKNEVELKPCDRVKDYVLRPPR